MTNPYSMPQAELTETVGDETYEPKFFALDGRIGRMRYWAYNIGWVLLLMPLSILVVGMGALTGSMGNAGAGGSALTTGISYLVSFVVTISLARRRLNDMGKTGWLACLLLIPFVNFFVWLWLVIGAGDAEANEYGPAPGPNSTGVKVLAWIAPVVFLGIIAAVAIPAYSAYVAKARAAQMSHSQ